MMRETGWCWHDNKRDGDEGEGEGDATQESLGEVGQRMVFVHALMGCYIGQVGDAWKAEGGYDC